MAVATASTPHLTYVALGDSLLYALAGDGASRSAVVVYGSQMATDLGLPVEVHNLTMHNGLNSAGLARYLQQGAKIGLVPENVLTAVAAADVVTVSIGFNDVPSGVTQTDPIVTAFEKNLDQIVTKIVELRAGQPTLLRLIEIYNNGIAPTAKDDPDGPGTGISYWKPIVEAQNAAICRVAAKHGATCVDVYRVFNGQDGTSAPAAAHLLGPDGVHPSQLGQDAIAAALVASGYAPLR